MPRDQTNEYRTIQTALKTAGDQVQVLMDWVQQEDALTDQERLQLSQTYSQAMVSINLLRTQFPWPP